MPIQNKAPLDVIPEVPQEGGEGNEANAENPLEDIRDFTQALMERSRLLHDTESIRSSRSRSRANYNESDSESVRSTCSTRASTRNQVVIAASSHEDRDIESIFTNINNVAVRVGEFYSTFYFGCDCSKI